MKKGDIEKAKIIAATKPVTGSMAKAAVKSVAKVAAKAIKSATAKPLAVVATKSAVKVAVKPATKPIAKPTANAKSLSKATAKPAASKTTKRFGHKIEDLKTNKKLIKDSEKSKSSDVFKKVSSDVANQEMNMLCQHYPEADCELDFDTPFQLITSVIMSAQTTDVNVNKVTPTLFHKYPDAISLAAAPLDDIKEIIKSTGFFNAKATNIQNCAKMLVEKFNGEVPRTIEELVTLPGVGRKTANVVLGVCFGVPGWTVDTHVQRLSKRLGFTNEQDPEKIEYALQKIFPSKDWSNLSITLIWHGRRICFARKPNCEACPINHICPSSLTP